MLGAKEAAATIPTVGIGELERIAGSLARPEGNVTGVINVPVEIFGKQFEVLKEAAPKISRLAYFVEAPPGSPEHAARAAAIGRSLQFTVHMLPVRTADELEAAFREALNRCVDAFVLIETPFLSANRARIVDFVAKHRLPSASMFSSFPESGFLVSYGTNIPQLYRRTAYYVDGLLRGEMTWNSGALDGPGI